MDGAPAEDSEKLSALGDFPDNAWNMAKWRKLLRIISLAERMGLQELVAPRIRSAVKSENPRVATASLAYLLERLAR